MINPPTVAETKMYFSVWALMQGCAKAKENKSFRSNRSWWNRNKQALVQICRVSAWCHQSFVMSSLRPSHSLQILTAKKDNHSNKTSRTRFSPMKVCCHQISRRLFQWYNSPKFYTVLVSSSLSISAPSTNTLRQFNLSGTFSTVPW